MTNLFAPRIWLGLDPSIAAFGWAVMSHYRGEQPQVLDLGTWMTKVDRDAGKLEDRARRSLQLAGQLVALVDLHKPTEAFVESLVVGGPRSGLQTASVLGRMRGIVEGVCVARGVALSEVRPDAVKAAVTGRRDASKEQVARVISKCYPSPRVFDSDTNATDALAVAHVGAHRFSPGYKLSANVVRYNPPAAHEEEIDF